MVSLVLNNMTELAALGDWSRAAGPSVSWRSRRNLTRQQGSSLGFVGPEPKTIAVPREKTKILRPHLSLSRVWMIHCWKKRT